MICMFTFSPRAVRECVAHDLFRALSLWGVGRGGVSATTVAIHRDHASEARLSSRRFQKAHESRISEISPLPIKVKLFPEHYM